ncbi:arylsulfatase [Paraglaciecola aquimarina]|uniref:Arylsulfatase n=1 Tax=Paraglaciecola aquimarina TaxID=1235557 RepID=A0ABU3T2E1_9ALTE|nr:arylsulfatase [Paraglaciecola aquimarina]MDU0356430.1 arylsulfatase [Paraglaciecola aquimarina]
MINKLRGILLPLSLALVGLSCASTKPQLSNKVLDKRKPNVIFIMVDDMGYGELGSYGQKVMRTPNLDQMAKEGKRFTQFYAGSAVCAPSRASLMTGKHSGHAHIRGNYELGGFSDETEFGQLPLLPATVTLGTMMQQAGYKTAAIGKWGLGGQNSVGRPNLQGFDYFFGYLDQKQAHNHAPTHLWRNQKWTALDNDFLDMHHLKLPNFDYNDPKSYAQFKRTDFAQARMNQDALNFIEQNQHQPFFLYLAYAMPHAALQAPDKEIEQYDFEVDPPEKVGYYMPVEKPRATRAAMVSYTDKHVGEVLNKLKALNIADNTLVIFTSDNGATPEGGADMAFFKANGDLRGFKRQLYEGGIRMPMLAWWPGKIAAGTVSTHIGAFWDVMPTLADLTQQSAPESTDGMSFLPDLLGQGEQAEHNYLYWEFPQGKHKAQAIRDGKWKAIRLYKGVKEKGYTTEFELYDLSKDVAETTDLASSHPSLVAKYKALMDTSRTRSWIDKWNFD